MQRSTVRLSWGSVSYLSWGSSQAPAVVLLHGAGVDSASLSWGEVGPRLAAGGYRVLAPDHPGYGHTAPAPWPSTQERLVAYVGEFVDALGLGRYAIGGLSLGGGMTIGHVLGRPQNVTGAMLLASYGLTGRLSEGQLSLVRQAAMWAMVRSGLLGAVTRWSGRSRAAMTRVMPALIRDPARRPPELVDEVLAAARSPHAFEAYGQWQRDEVGCTGLRTDYRDRLPSFPRPALLVHGDRDSSVPVSAARAAAHVMPDARLEFVAGAAHWVQRDRPDVVVAAMLEFLGGLS
ncbi:alpha/beta hydrolase [Mycolicibacterium flavescens]|uniref:Alpha/beta hydrolase n=1 Tax=Mycolicibacterium flavescens TaxID=1776 RepID=A0A1E3RQY1_MYCFV|nr:alpha/beta hydrolase [Mycolicibacterium flavescens]MCV7279612.1 alpha/beta hydrolase [Mycolicibacterium flavescens]ODQ92264.1 alpha/beta hydrolase [Mycolicibacterium flavescens]